MIYDTHSNESPFKYHISFLGGMGGLRPCLFCLFRGGWRVENFENIAYIILAHSLTGLLTKVAQASINYYRDDLVQVSSKT